MRRWTEEEEDQVEDAITFWLTMVCVTIGLFCAAVMFVLVIGGW